ncbi:37001_t:CDS:2 [Gigaspora margarita]|uniref:37001_t:CDS:1 n=1 Tax=Gigaspora margarita TaxID=4874 RepID=A0ABM8W2S1_GIGMA|nr:37001_t:CDS:2 [Gigaspora margarita]
MPTRSNEINFDHAFNRISQENNIYLIDPITIQNEKLVKAFGVGIIEKGTLNLRIIMKRLSEESVKKLEEQSTRSIFIDKTKVKIANPIFFEIDSDAMSTISFGGEVAAFMDPEPLNNREIEFTAASNIYSLGVIMWTISSGRQPFEDITNQSVLVSRIINDSIREKPVIDTPEAYLDLYQKCWDIDSKKRPTIDGVCEQLEIMSQEEPFNGEMVLTFDTINAQNDLQISNIDEVTNTTITIAQENQFDQNVPEKSRQNKKFRKSLNNLKKLFNCT